jgi:hypothetical protein
MLNSLDITTKKLLRSSNQLCDEGAAILATGRWKMLQELYIE